MEYELNQLKAHGFKLTQQRREILKVLREQGPILAEELCVRVNQRSKINLSTVYRNLHMLLTMGLIQKTHTIRSADAYELVDGDCRHALACLKCGNRIQFSECHFDRIMRDVEVLTGFHVTGHRLEVIGTCRDCKEDIK
jgi:Fur family ferric uptake transcriptional regulator